MRISARADYALRAALELAAVAGSETPVTGDVLAERHDIPRAFLDGIMCDLRAARLVTSRRGPSGGDRPSPPPRRGSGGGVPPGAPRPPPGVRGRPPAGAGDPRAPQPLALGRR